MKKLFVLLSGLLLLVSTLPVAAAQNAAFTYQGRLNANEAPANGIYDLRFTIYDALSGGGAVGGPVTNAPTSVSNGLFVVTLDFGAGVFTGADRWLAIGVRTNASVDAYQALSPRQRITSTPYATRAANFNGSVAASQITGTIPATNIGAGSITMTMLAAGAVGSNQLASGAVTTTALADGTVTAAKIATVSNWFFALAIPNPSPAFADWFGYSVAAAGIDRVLVGAVATSGGGAVYLFSNNGTLLTTFTNPTPAASDFFGRSITTVGTDWVLIGADGDDSFGNDAGTAHLFGTNGAFLGSLVDPFAVSGGRFGCAATAVGTDRMLIGAFGSAGTAGAAYLFRTNGGYTIFTNPTPASGDRFGSSVAVVGSDRVLISADFDDTGATDAGAAYLFSTNGALLTTFTNPTPAVSENFGRSMTVVGTDRVLIGAPGDDTGATDSGAAYLFSTNGTLLITFTNPTPAANDHFGRSVAAVAADRLLIGADGDSTGASGAGAAYLFSTNGVLLATFTNPTPAANDNFGASVVAAGANQVLIGAPYDNTGATDAGEVYLFSIENYTPGLIADGVNARSITTDNVEDGAVTLAKLDPTIGVWTRSGDNVYRTVGNVGIGTATPTALLHVSAGALETKLDGNSISFTRNDGPAYVASANRIDFVTGGRVLSDANANLLLNSDMSSTFNGSIQMGANNGDYRQFRLGGGNSAGFLYGSFLRYADGIHLGYNYYANAAGQDVIVNPGGATSRITAGYGFVTLAVGGVNAAPAGVGTDRLVANSSGVNVFGSFTANGSAVVNGVFTASSDAYIYGYTRMLGNARVDGNFEVGGSAYKPGGGSWSNLSDERVKKNVRTLSGALDKLMALRGVNFEYIDPARFHELPGERIGLIAQEVEKVIPDWVETGKDGYKRVTVRGLEALVVEALRELQQKQEASTTKLTEELKRRDAENAELKQQNESLEKRLEALENFVRNPKSN